MKNSIKRHFGLIGYSLKHSFSQKYFTEKWAESSISDCAYHLFPIEHISDLSEVIRTHPGLEGLNVTIPYKEAVLPYVHRLSPEAEAIGAVNVLKLQDGQILGYNSDVYGFEESLRPQLKPWHERALVLGTGGASKAVVYVLQHLGINYKMVSREKSTHTLNYAEITPEILADSYLVINTTPLGMYPNMDRCPDLPYHAVGPRHLFFDLIYNPEKTLFLSRAQQNGAHILNGLEMLVLQAEKSWEIWNR